VFCLKQKLIFLNCSFVESAGAMFEVSSLLRRCAVSTDVLDDRLASIFMSGSVKDSRVFRVLETVKAVFHFAATVNAVTYMTNFVL
jgi:hypothetical protein